MSSSQNSSSSEAPARPDPFEPLHDVVCKVEVTLGSTFLSVRECVQLRRDSLIRFEQSAGSDMRVSVNGIVLAHGEVVMMDDSTAIRVTEVIAPPSSEAA